jgi:hypothetical protein
MPKANGVFASRLPTPDKVLGAGRVRSQYWANFWTTRFVAMPQLNLLAILLLYGMCCNMDVHQILDPLIPALFNAIVFIAIALCSGVIKRDWIRN